jgi:6-phosphogluconate dehydrogenase (decarboxylating)
MEQPLKLGFVGLGAMGLPMASNLISKSPEGSVLFIYDISTEITKQLADKHKDSVEMCKSAREVAQRAVSDSCNSHFASYRISHELIAHTFHHVARRIPC